MASNDNIQLNFGETFLYDESTTLYQDIMGNNGFESDVPVEALVIGTAVYSGYDGDVVCSIYTYDGHIIIDDPSTGCYDVSLEGIDITLERLNLLVDSLPELCTDDHCSEDFK